MSSNTESNVNHEEEIEEEADALLGKENHAVSSTQPTQKDGPDLESGITKAEKADSNEKKTLWIFTPQFKLIASHFLSSWGDRMWMFSGGLFLIEMTPGSFRLIAIYESVLSLTVIILGSTVGRWVDRESRINAAQMSLVVQNVMVCSCTLLLCFAISYNTHFSQSLYGWGNVVAQVGVIIMAAIGQIGSLGTKLSIENDWIVVISRSCGVDLSTMNSVMRTIDLSTKMMAPVLVGVVMTAAGTIYGGIVIGAWNVVSMMVEYSLLHHLYYSIAELRAPKLSKKTNVNQSANNKTNGILSKMKDAVLTWKQYFIHHIRDAGLSLSLLYMTVMSLDNFSRVYLYESGVSKAILGVMTAIASLNGIAGSVTYPLLHKRFGTVRTGLFGFIFEVTCLLFGLAAVFSPGTLFEPSALWGPYAIAGNESQHVNSSLMISEIAYRNQSYEFDLQNGFYYSTKENDFSTNFTGLVNYSKNSSIDVTEYTVGIDYTSAALLLTGIITSRLGLWIADLAVTQILQEEVEDNERGGINGVQYSLNQIFSLLRSTLLIFLPSMKTFGYLVILSFIFVLIATILFSKFTYVSRKVLKQNVELQLAENAKPASSNELATVL